MTRRKKKDASYLADVEKNNAAPQPAIDIDKIRKEYLKIMCLQKKQKNNLLGDFSSDGKYTFKNEELIQALLSIPKHLDEKDDDIYYASARLGTFLLNFKIVFEMDATFCKSTIYLIETEEKTEESVKHLTKLDANESVYQTLYREEMLTYWNIYRDEDYVQKEEDEKKILDYLDSQEKERDFSKELTEILAQIYILRMLAALENCGELGQKIKNEYKLLIEKIMKGDPSISQDYTRMKAILDEIIQKNNAYDTLMQNPEVAKAMETFSVPIMRLYDKEKVSNTEAAPIKNKETTPEKKAESAPAKKSKPESKSKSGGGKSDDGGGKKKDDKKKEEHKGAPIVLAPLKNTPPPQKKQATPELNEDDLEAVSLSPEIVNAFLEQNESQIISNSSELSVIPEDKQGEDIITNNSSGSGSTIPKATQSEAPKGTTIPRENENSLTL